MITLKCKFSFLFSFFLWVVLLSAYPVIFSFACGIPYMIPLSFGTLCLCLLLLFKKQKTSICIIDFIFILNLLFWGGQFLFRNDSSYVSNIIQIIIIYVFYLAVLNGTSIFSFSKQYVYVMTLVATLGAVSMCGVFIFNIPPILTYNAHDGRLAYIFPFTATNTYYQLPHPIIRFSGIFDEPGALAFYSMFALLINRSVIKDRKAELLLLVSPIFTFSVAHLFTAFLYSILFKIVRAKYLFFLALLLSLSVVLIYSLKDSDFSAIYKLTLYRFEQNDSGDIQGDNRSENAINALDYFNESPVVGYGKTYFEDKVGEVGFNIFYTGAMYGLLGYIFIYSFWGWGVLKALRSSHKNESKDALKCYFIILINMFQRPYITNVLEVSVVLLFVLAVNFSTYQSKKSIYVRA